MYSLVTKHNPETPELPAHIGYGIQYRGGGINFQHIHKTIPCRRTLRPV